MRYLCFQRRAASQGGRKVPPVIKTKDRKYGPVVDVEVVTRKTPTFITGLHDSGKSRMLERLHAEERQIWGAKVKAPALWLGALRPLGVWSDAPHVADWWTRRAAELQNRFETGETVAAGRFLLTKASAANTSCTSSPAACFCTVPDASTRPWASDRIRIARTTPSKRRACPPEPPPFH